MTIQQRAPQKSSTVSSVGASARAKSSTPGGEKPAPTHAQIAALAKSIWESKGRPAGRDEENWRQAEAELRSTAQGKL